MTSKVLLTRCVCAPALAGLLAWPCAAETIEPAAELQLTASVIEVAPGPTGAGGALTGTARVGIDAVALEGVRDVTLRVMAAHPEGGPRTEIASARWSDFQGRQVAPILAQLDPSRGIRLYLDVPLQGRGIHDVVVEIAATGPRGELRGEAYARIPLGVALDAVTDDGEVAAFPMAVSR